MIDQSQEISPYCELFDSDDVWYFGDYVMLESEQKSEIPNIVTIKYLTIRVYFLCLVYHVFLSLFFE